MVNGRNWRFGIAGHAIAAVLALVPVICSCATGSHIIIPDGAAITVQKNGVDAGREKEPGAKYCDNFRLNDAQIKAFFGNADVIDERQLKELYYDSPCMVEGEFTTGNAHANWKILATLTGIVRYEDGREVLLGCGDNCTDSLIELQDDREDGPYPMWNTNACIEKTKIEWSHKERDGLPNGKIFKIIEDKVKNGKDDDFVLIQSESIKPVDLVKMGLPGAKDWMEISGGTKYKYYHLLRLKNSRILVADTGGDAGSGTQDFYLDVGNGFKNILHLNFCYFEFYSISGVQDKGEFIEMIAGYGGSGWSGHIYRFSDNGRLEKLLNLGGWRPSTYFLNLGYNGNFIAVGMDSTSMVDDPWRKEIKRCPGYNEYMLAGPQMLTVSVYRWDNEKFEDLGLFHIGDFEIVGNH